MKNIIITGGAGFIGSHVVREFVKNNPDKKIINLDALTYAGNLENLKDIENEPNYVFEKADITKVDELRRVFEKHHPDAVVHLAAESHVDRSITDPNAFINTNVVGFPCFRFMETLEDRFCVVDHIKPVARIFSVAIDGKRFSVQDIVNAERNQLFRKMVWTVIIGTVRDNKRHSVSVSISANQMIGSGFTCRIRRLRIVSSSF